MAPRVPKVCRETLGYKVPKATLVHRDRPARTVRMAHRVRKATLGYRVRRVTSVL